MADAGFIIYSTAIGAFSALFSIWWTRWIFENNPNIPNDRTYLQGLFVLALLASCWFLTFALIQEDVGNLPKSSGERGSVTNLPTSTYAVFCVFISFVLLLWDCFCRGRSCRGQPPHLIPAFPSCFAIGAVCCLVIPGLTFLAVYERESSGSIPNPHQDYVEHLFPKGVAMVVIGFTVNFLALFMYLREKALVPAALQGGERSDGADLPPGS